MGDCSNLQPLENTETLKSMWTLLPSDTILNILEFHDTSATNRISFKDRFGYFSDGDRDYKCLYPHVTLTKCLNGTGGITKIPKFFDVPIQGCNIESILNFELSEEHKVNLRLLFPSIQSLKVLKKLDALGAFRKGLWQIDYRDTCSKTDAQKFSSVFSKYQNLTLWFNFHKDNYAIVIYELIANHNIENIKLDLNLSFFGKTALPTSVVATLSNHVHTIELGVLDSPVAKLKLFFENSLFLEVIRFNIERRGDGQSILIMNELSEIVEWSKLTRLKTVEIGSTPFRSVFTSNQNAEYEMTNEKLMTCMVNILKSNPNVGVIKFDFHHLKFSHDLILHLLASPKNPRIEFVGAVASNFSQFESIAQELKDARNRKVI